MISKQFGTPLKLSRNINTNALSIIFKVVLDSYQILVNNNQVQYTWDEDEITLELYTVVNEQWRSLPPTSPGYHLTPIHQYPVYPKQYPIGRAPFIDFVFRKGYSKQEYFAFECKKLFSNKKRYIREYVRNGIYRYIQGTYSSGMHKAAMIGYVFNGVPDSLIDALNHFMQKTFSSTTIMELKKEKIIDNYQFLYKSEHTRFIQNDRFKIYHIFLSF